MNQSDLVQRMSLGHPNAIDSSVDPLPSAKGMTARDRSLTLAALTNLYLNAGCITAEDGSLAIAALTNFHLNMRGMTATVAKDSWSPDASTMEPQQSDMPLEVDAVFMARYPQLVQRDAKSGSLDQPRGDRDLPEVVTAPAKPLGSGLSRSDRLLIFAGYAAAVPALTVGLLNQGWFTSRVQPPSPDSGLAIDQANVQFSEYMLRTLDGMDRVTAANSKVVADRSKQVLANLVTRTELNGAVTGLVTRSELNQFMQQLLTILNQKAAISANQLPAPENLVMPPDASRAAAVRPAASPAVTAPNPASQRRLSGVVDWGDKSVVMIEYNGQTQRTYLGQDVGSTGWTLVSVNADQATFHKQGQYQTVADGEFLQ